MTNFQWSLDFSCLVYLVESCQRRQLEADYVIYLVRLVVRELRLAGQNRARLQHVTFY